jgi:hypothetical protein
MKFEVLLNSSQQQQARHFRGRALGQFRTGVMDLFVWAESSFTSDSALEKSIFSLSTFVKVRFFSLNFKTELRFTSLA